VSQPPKQFDQDAGRSMPLESLVDRWLEAGQADIPHGIFTLMTQAIGSTYLTLKKWSEIGVGHLD